MYHLVFHPSDSKNDEHFFEFHHIDASDPFCEMPLHWHKEWEFIRILSGTFVMILESGIRILHSGDCIFISSDRIHGGTPHNCSYEILRIDTERLLEENLFFREHLDPHVYSHLPLSPWIPTGDFIWHLVQNLFQAAGSRNYGYPLTAMGLLFQFFGNYLPKCSGYESSSGSLLRVQRGDPMKPVLQKIRNDFSSHLTLDDLSREAGMGKKYFCTTFRQMTGQTPFEYLNYYRTEYAAYLLCTSSQSVTSVSRCCGFHDPGYFARIFRCQKGLSPLEYRKRYTC